MKRKVVGLKRSSGRIPFNCANKKEISARKMIMKQELQQCKRWFKTVIYIEFQQQLKIMRNNDKRTVKNEA